MARFALARTALLPVFSVSNTLALQRVLAEGGPPLASLILRHQLGPLWHARTQASGLAASRARAALAYLRQRAALRNIDTLFERVGICYAVIKGAGTRERLYDDPAQRVCSDIDILVAPRQRIDAARALAGSGYRLHLDPANVSHEVGLSSGIVTIDLHWDILRPGRTRVPVVDGLLARRQRHDGLWMLSDTDTLFLMLVHPAISKHVSMSLMGLHRVAEIALWLQRRDLDWPRVCAQLEACGLKTAAWTVLNWVRILSPADFHTAVDPVMDSLKPGRLRGAYLASWLTHDLSTRLAPLHAVRLLGFSAWLHDRPSDAWHTLERWRHARKCREGDARLFKQLADEQKAT